MRNPVGPRVSKEEFMHALGLNPHDPNHEQYYRAMRDEAIITYNRMNQDTTYLLDSLRADPTTRPPYFWHHIRPESQRWGILEIWRNAGPVTRPLFDRGSTQGEYGPNWVTAWLLYSVFRSRDVRNNRNRRRVHLDGGGSGHGHRHGHGSNGGGGEVNGNGYGVNGHGLNGHGHGHDHGQGSNGVSRRSRGVPIAGTGSTSASTSTSTTRTNGMDKSPTTEKMYYDPVRNGLFK